MKLRGHYSYYGVTGNARALERFFQGVRYAWRKWLSRRSRRSYISWERFLVLEERYSLPLPRVVQSVYGRAANP